MFASLLPGGLGETENKISDKKKRVLSERYLTDVLLKTCLDERHFAAEDAVDEETGRKLHNPWPLGIKVLRNSHASVVLCAPGLVCDVGVVDVTHGYAAAVLVNQLDTEAEATGVLLKEVAKVVGLGADGGGGEKSAGGELCPYVPWGKEQRAMVVGRTRTGGGTK